MSPDANIDCGKPAQVPAQVRKAKVRLKLRLLARLSTAAALSAALVLGACEQVYQRGYVLPEGALEQIPVGSSQEQVLVVMGTPSTVATVSGEAFYYISQKGAKPIAFMPQKVVDQRVIAVYFDKNRRVERLADYGMRDGKVFDFVSRTTPAGGKELSYLTYLFKIIGLDPK